MLPIFPIPPAASALPSGEKARARTPPMEWSRCTGSQVYMTGASISATDLPVATSQTLILPTLSPVARYLPSGENVAANNMDEKPFEVFSTWPRNSWLSFPVAASHRRHTMSSPTLATDLPFGLTRTRRIHLSWASADRITLPASTSYQINLPSYPPLTRVLPNRATPVT